MATVISAWTNTVMLAWVLRKRGFLKVDDRLKSKTVRIILSCALMAGTLYGAGMVLEEYLSGNQVMRIAALAGLIFTGLLSYFITAQLVGAARLSEVKSMMKRG